MKQTFSYTLTGLVLGDLWMNGKGTYPTIRLSADTKDELISLAEKALSDGSLDSGMGFQNLIGALLFIDTITSINYNGDVFINSKTEEMFIGDLTDEDKDLLSDVYYC